MAVTYVGETAYEQEGYPLATKNEWGVDMLAIPWNGALTLQDAFVGGLSQGSTITYNGATFYLQTWQAEQSAKAYGRVTLFYKGFLSGSPPASFQINDFVEASGTKSVTTPENRVYDFTYRQPTAVSRQILTSISDPGDLITVTDPIIFLKSYYTKDDGTRRSGFPAGVSLVYRLIAKRAFPIFGTPYYEAEFVGAGVVDA